MSSKRSIQQHFLHHFLIVVSVVSSWFTAFAAPAILAEETATTFENPMLVPLAFSSACMPQGLYAAGNGEKSTAPADFAWFDYEIDQR